MSVTTTYESSDRSVPEPGPKRSETPGVFGGGSPQITSAVTHRVSRVPGASAATLTAKALLPQDAEDVRRRLFQYEATLTAIRSNAALGDEGLAGYVLSITEDLGLSPRFTEPERVPQWVCLCAQEAGSDWVGDVPCSPSWCVKAAS